MMKIMIWILLLAGLWGPMAPPPPDTPGGPLPTHCVYIGKHGHVERVTCPHWTDVRPWSRPFKPWEYEQGLMVNKRDKKS